MNEWRKCDLHPDVNGDTMWGCPDCLAELRLEIGRIKAKWRVISDLLPDEGMLHRLGLEMDALIEDKR